MTNEMTLPVLAVKDGTVITNSRNVADFFEKRHADVLRSIDLLECSDGFRERNFALTEEVGQVGAVVRTIRSFDMTKDGFTFLCMGFTGSAAAQFKEAYIQRFNEMEEEIYRLEAEAAEGQGEALQPEITALRIVSEGRRLWGNKVGQQLWGLQGLPVVPAMLLPPTNQLALFG